MTGKNATVGHELSLVVWRAFQTLMGIVAIGTLPHVAEQFGTTVPEGLQLALIGMLVGGAVVDAHHRSVRN